MSGVTFVSIESSKFSDLSLKKTFSGFLSNVQAHIYNVISEYPNQKVWYEIDGLPVMDETSRRLYESFGLFVDSTAMSRSLDKRNYLLIVDPNVSDLEEYCRKFVQVYLPADPTYFVVNKEMTSYSEMVSWNNKVMELYPNILPLAEYPRLKEEYFKQGRVEEREKELTAIGKIPLNISAYAKEISDAVDSGNYITMSKILEVEKKIRPKLKKDVVLVSDNDSSDADSLLASYLFYKYEVPSHFNELGTKKMMSHLSTLMFDRNRMLVEDQFKYVHGLPDLMLMMNNDMQFLVVLLKGEMKSRVTIGYIPAEGDGTFLRMETDSRELEIVSMKDEFPFKDKGTLSYDHGRLLDILRKLDEKVKIHDTTCNVTNSFFFEKDGTKYIAKIENWDLQLPVILVPVNHKLARTKMTLGLDSISSLYTVNLLPGFESYVTNYFREWSARGFSVKKWKIDKVNNPLGLFMMSYSHRGPNILSWENYFDFYTAGLWWVEPVKYRLFLVKEMSKDLDILKFRKKSDFLSAFGGPHPSLRNDFVITEEFMKG